ncbi:hypothetical protein V9T20_12510 (plasmid) [Halobacterium salinarum]|uniref:hypothetical protein n=1 Tax=Halobacterium salinarum TaxID=2242 RepID=UPI0030D3BA5C
MDEFESCARDNCDLSLAWDHTSIALDDTVYCSPACALIDLPNRSVEVVALHDPQSHRTHEDHPDVDEEAVDVWRDVSSKRDVVTALNELQGDAGPFLPPRAAASVTTLDAVRKREALLKESLRTLDVDAPNVIEAVRAQEAALKDVEETTGGSNS